MVTNHEKKMLPKCEDRSLTRQIEFLDMPRLRSAFTQGFGDRRMLLWGFAGLRASKRHAQLPEVRNESISYSSYIGAVPFQLLLQYPFLPYGPPRHHSDEE